ncbi:MAG: hypothetical protein ACKVQQ_19095 [Burkholderiales bacterium]
MRIGRSDERSWRAVPVTAWIALSLSICLQLAFDAAQPRPAATANALGPPPSAAAIRLASLGDPLPIAKALNLILQAHDNQPGKSIPFAELDYPMLIRWLTRILEIDPRGPYPLFAASRLYGEVPDADRQRLMLDFVYEEFKRNPDLHWAALAHAAHVARHRLRDLERTRIYAKSLREETSADRVPAWARQMEILLLADLDETTAARVLLGAMIESGGVRDATELRFLMTRLTEAEARQGSASSRP